MNITKVKPFEHEEKNIGITIEWADKWGSHKGKIIGTVVHYNAQNLANGHDYRIDCGSDGERFLRPWGVRDAIANPGCFIR